MKRRRYCHFRLRTRRIDPDALSTALPVAEFAEKTNYTTRAIYRQIHRNHLVAYRVNGQWYVPYPAIWLYVP